MPDSRDRTTKGQFAKGNKASMSSGLAHGLAHSRLPKGMSKLQRDLTRWRRHLEDGVRRKHGPTLTAQQDGMIASAVVHERRRRLAERFLTLRWEAGDLGTEELDRLQEIAGLATSQRDEVTAKLMGEVNSFTPPADPSGPFGISPAAMAALQERMAYLDKPRNDLDAK